MRSPNIPETTWIDVQTDWESGLYTIRDLSKKWGIKEKAIIKKQERCSKNGHAWQKARTLDEIVEVMRQKKIRIIAERRLDEKAYEAIDEALEAKIEKTIPSNNIDADGNKEPGFVTIIADHTSRMKAVEQLRKLGGLDEAQKKELAGNLRISQETGLENLPIEKIKKIREIMLSEGSEFITKGNELMIV